MLERLHDWREDRKARRAAGIKPLELQDGFWIAVWEASVYTTTALWDRELDHEELEGIRSRWERVFQLADFAKKEK